MQFHITQEKDRRKTRSKRRKKEKQQHGDFAFNLFVDVNSFVCINKWLTTLFICSCVCVYVYVLMHSPMCAIGNYTKITSQRVSHSLTRANTLTNTHTYARTFAQYNLKIRFLTDHEQVRYRPNDRHSQH